MQLEREQESYIWKQEMEDRSVERDARIVATDLLRQEIANPGGLLVQKSVRFILTEYPGQKAKYDDAGYQKLISRYFKEMKSEWLSAILAHVCP